MDTKIKDLICKGKICPYCNNESVYTDNAEVYGKSSGMVYLCRPCKAYVGVHKGTSKALGRLSKKELRSAKQRAHFYFDKIAKTSKINKIWRKKLPNTSNRSKAYKWLSMQLDIDPKYCHIGMMDEAQCGKVAEICKRVLKQYR